MVNQDRDSVVAPTGGDDTVAHLWSTDNANDVNFFLCSIKPILLTIAKAIIDEQSASLNASGFSMNPAKTAAKTILNDLSGSFDSIVNELTDEKVTNFFHFNRENSFIQIVLKKLNIFRECGHFTNLSDDNLLTPESIEQVASLILHIMRAIHVKLKNDKKVVANDLYILLTELVELLFVDDASAMLKSASLTLLKLSKGQITVRLDDSNCPQSVASDIYLAGLSVLIEKLQHQPAELGANTEEIALDNKDCTANSALVTFKKNLEDVLGNGLSSEDQKKQLTENFSGLKNSLTEVTKSLDVANQTVATEMAQIIKALEQVASIRNIPNLPDKYEEILDSLAAELATKSEAIFVRQQNLQQQSSLINPLFTVMPTFERLSTLSITSAPSLQINLPSIQQCLAQVNTLQQSCESLISSECQIIIGQKLRVLRMQQQAEQLTKQLTRLHAEYVSFNVVLADKEAEVEQYKQATEANQQQLTTCLLAVNKALGENDQNSQSFDANQSIVQVQANLDQTNKQLLTDKASIDQAIKTVTQVSRQMANHLDSIQQQEDLQESSDSFSSKLEQLLDTQEKQAVLIDEKYQRLNIKRKDEEEHMLVGINNISAKVTSLDSKYDDLQDIFLVLKAVVGSALVLFDEINKEENLGQKQDLLCIPQSSSPELAALGNIVSQKQDHLKAQKDSIREKYQTACKAMQSFNSSIEAQHLAEEFNLQGAIKSQLEGFNVSYREYSKALGVIDTKAQIIECQALKINSIIKLYELLLEQESSDLKDQSNLPDGFSELSDLQGFLQGFSENLTAENRDAFFTEENSLFKPKECFDHFFVTVQNASDRANQYGSDSKKARSQIQRYKLLQDNLGALLAEIEKENEHHNGKWLSTIQLLIFNISQKVKALEKQQGQEETQQWSEIKALSEKILLAKQELSVLPKQDDAQLENIPDIEVLYERQRTVNAKQTELQQNKSQIEQSLAAVRTKVDSAALTPLSQLKERINQEQLNLLDKELDQIGQELVELNTLIRKYDFFVAASDLFSSINEMSQTLSSIISGSQAIDDTVKATLNQQLKDISGKIQELEKIDSQEVSNILVIQTIRESYQGYRQLIDSETAVGYVSLYRDLKTRAATLEEYINSRKWWLGAVEKDETMTWQQQWRFNFFSFFINTGNLKDANTLLGKIRAISDESDNIDYGKKLLKVKEIHENVITSKSSLRSSRFFGSSQYAKHLEAIEKVVASPAA